MSTSAPELGARPGLANVADIFIAPNAAFARLRQVPTWGWALLAGALLGIVGSLLAGPSIQHAMEVSLPAQLAADPNMAKLSPDQQQKQIAAIVGVTKNVSKFYWIFSPLILLCIGLIQALVMTIANVISKGDGGFKKYFALSINVAVIGYGLNSLVVGLVATLRGPASFESTTAIQGSIPSLALLVPSAHGALVGFLSALNVFYLWATALLAFGMTGVGRIPRAAAWTTAIVLLLLTALFSAYGARNG